ncbi:hypothetical protein LX81_03529 [Palleronia aestuarii]|uniref:Uncharacterized protein n=1 Tax=Palleronia aestuarii TaxID=568105 RepID=A0A2W7NNI1_9RHOB|nr:YeeE/YedE family protein [Palleronia aestuarii]PZX12822.1 hypothetical protein LX81_03529 [Palleronia aestuarii]
MIALIGEPGFAALIGLISGIVLGLAARLGRFCTLGAIEDQLYGNDCTRLRMWGVAIGSAMVLSFVAMALGLVDPTESFYLSETWSLAAAILGGLAFGYGMALAGNCGYGALARAGGGDLRSLVIVLVMGLAAYATLSGPLAGLRTSLFPRMEATAPQGIAHVLGPLIGMPIWLVGCVIGVVIIAASIVGPVHGVIRLGGLIWGTIVGLAIAFAWIATSWLNQTGFDELPVVSHTFSAPIGEFLLYVMTSSGAHLSFGIGSVAGVVAGAFLGSFERGQFRWEACDDPRELRRQIMGAVLMGWGAVTASGCSIGQGLSAFSFLAFSAPVTLIAIWIGAALGLRKLMTGYLLPTL